MAELKNKFNRVASDASQAQQFADKVCDSLDNGEGEFNKVFSENQIKSLVNEGIESGEINGGTKLYKHNITISRVGGSPYLFVFITNSSNQMSLEDGHINSDIGIVISGYDITNSNTEFYRCSKLGKPFPTATFITCLREVGKSVGEEGEYLGYESLSITPTGISDIVTPL